MCVSVCVYQCVCVHCCCQVGNKLQYAARQLAANDDWHKVFANACKYPRRGDPMPCLPLLPEPLLNSVAWIFERRKAR